MEYKKLDNHKMVSREELEKLLSQQRRQGCAADLIPTSGQGSMRPTMERIKGFRMCLCKIMELQGALILFLLM